MREVLFEEYLLFLLLILLVAGLTACADSDIGDRERIPAETDSTGHEMQTTETGELAERQESSENNDEDRQEPDENGNTESNVLIAYFSWAENAVQDDIDAMTSASVKLPGNVAQLASWIAEETGGGLFSIQVTEPYPAGRDECLSRANQEKADGSRPELIQNTVNMDNYEVIFLGYPNWWYICSARMVQAGWREVWRIFPRFCREGIFLKMYLTLMRKIRWIHGMIWRDG